MTAITQVVSSAPACASQPLNKTAGKTDKRELHKLAQRIKRYHASVVEQLRQSVDFAMMCGDLLLEAKEQVAHGQWGEWVSRHCEISDRTARLYMQLAQHRGVIEAKTATVADLTLQGAAKAIAAPKAKGTLPLPKASQKTAVRPRPVNGFTHHDLMDVWLKTPDAEQRRFMSAVGLTYRDADVHAAPPALPVAISDWRPAPSDWRPVS